MVRSMETKSPTTRQTHKVLHLVHTRGHEAGEVIWLLLRVPGWPQSAVQDLQSRGSAKVEGVVPLVKSERQARKQGAELALCARDSDKVVHLRGV